MPSNYEAMVRCLVFKVRGHGTSQYDDGAERRAEALHAARIIYERLKTLPDTQLSVLKTLYTPDDFPEALESVCGWLTPLVCALPRAHHELEQAGADGRTLALAPADWLTDLVLAKGAVAMKSLVDEARSVAFSALAAYESTRPAFGRSVLP
jgi:hypothetical protein